jgi:hypothetical protein
LPAPGDIPGRAKAAETIERLRKQLCDDYRATVQVLYSCVSTAPGTSNERVVYRYRGPDTQGH